MRHLALHDPLTGLPNRMLFQRSPRPRPGPRPAQRRASGGDAARPRPFQGRQRQPWAHRPATRCCARSPQRLATVARASDTWARLGGDEFALVQEGLQRPDGAVAMASGCWQRWNARSSIEEHELDVGCSLGVTLFPADGDTPEQLVRNADVALYRAKAAGRGRFEPYRSELDRELRRSRKLQRELRQRSSVGGLELAYQPVFELPRPTAVQGRGAVAVAPARRHCRSRRRPSSRWPRGSGLIHRLGDWVLHAACRQGAEWQRGGPAAQDRGQRLGGAIASGRVRGLVAPALDRGRARTEPARA